jgi:ketosteroid isomerase-like protein
LAVEYVLGHFQKGLGMKMNKSVLAAALLMICCGCGTHGDTQMTEQEKQTITKGVKEAVDVIVKNSEQGNLEASLAPYWNSPDFIAFNSDGTMWDFDAFRKADVEYFAMMTSQKITTLQDAVRILSRDVVIYAWRLRFDMTLKYGRMMSMGPAGLTLVFKRMNNEWKVVYSHESSLPAGQ